MFCIVLQLKEEALRKLISEEEENNRQVRSPSPRTLLPRGGSGSLRHDIPCSSAIFHACVHSSLSPLRGRPWLNETRGPRPLARGRVCLSQRNISSLAAGNEEAAAARAKERFRATLENGFHRIMSITGIQSVQVQC